MSSKPQQVGDLATSAVLTLRRNDKLSIADDLMRQKRIRHLPVLDEDGLLCGIVSQRDLFLSGLVQGWSGPSTPPFLISAFLLSL